MIPKNQKIPDKKCSKEGCEETFRGHYWGHIHASDWFHQKDGTHWCPKHIPDWVASWRSRKPSS